MCVDDKDIINEFIKRRNVSMDSGSRGAGADDGIACWSSSYSDSSAERSWPAPRILFTGPDWAVSEMT